MKLEPGRLDAAVKALVEMGARRVILFGSYLENPAQANDIDLAVEGIPKRRILDADVRVRKALRAPYDLVNRELAPDFYDIVSKYGKTLYAQTV